MAAQTLEFGPPLPCSRLRRLVYRFANADPADIACHADRSRWTRIATFLALYFLYASLGTFTFLRGILSGSQLDCALGAAVVAGSVISFDRGIVGTTNANMELVEVQGEDGKAAANLVRAHADPCCRRRRRCWWAGSFSRSSWLPLSLSSSTPPPFTPRSSIKSTMNTSAT